MSSGLLFSTIREGIYDWVSTIVDPTPVIWADQNSPKPLTPFVTLRISPSSMVGQDYHGSPDEDGELEVIGNREFTLMMQHFGAGGYDAMEKIGSSLELFTIQNQLGKVGLAYARCMQTLDISAVQDARFEQRYTKDIMFRTHYVQIDDVPPIEIVSTDSTIKAQTDIEENRTISPFS